MPIELMDFHSYEWKSIRSGGGGGPSEAATEQRCLWMTYDVRDPIRAR